MKPLDLERFEGATAGPRDVFEVGDKFKAYTVAVDGHSLMTIVHEDEDAVFAGYHEKADAELSRDAPMLIAELKALRAWRQTINKAVEEGLYDENKVDMYNVILEAWNAAETELHDGKF